MAVALANTAQVAIDLIAHVRVPIAVPAIDKLPKLRTDKQSFENRRAHPRLHRSKARRRMTRAFRQAICRILIGVVLFAQMAVAAYACPAMSMTKSASAEAMASMVEAADEGVSPCPVGSSQMDMDSPNLCAAHCQFGEQTADPSPGLAVPAPVLASFYVVALPTPPVASVRPAAAEPDRLAAASPPHAILHCCFRI